MRVPAVARAYRLLDFGPRIAHYDADVGDAGTYEVFDGIEEHRLVSHRHKLLGASVSNWPQARALAAAEYQSFHKSPLRLRSYCVVRIAYCVLIPYAIRNTYYALPSPSRPKDSIHAAQLTSDGLWE